jgi:uncharacterized protein
MRYNVAQLLKGPTGQRRHFELHENIEQLDPELTPVAPVTGSVTLTRTSQGILATGRLQTRLRVECSRCLEPYDADVELDLEEEFHPTVMIDDAPLDPIPKEDRDQALDIDAHHNLDLSEVVRQGLLLALPMELLCRPDCLGLCPNCGGNRNLGECRCEPEPADPRWLALQDLLSNDSDSEERSD